MTYEEFLDRRTNAQDMHGFEPVHLPDFLFDFQRYLVTWALQKGRAAIFADCGMGKTPMQLVWAENVVRKTNGRVLILTPLAVSAQTKKEGEKFGIEVLKSNDGKVNGPGVYVTNYERLHYFDSKDFVGVVCDESSILKNFNGATKTEITRFGLKLPYRLLCTATAAPNDYIELGTSSEALGELGYMDMLQAFFKSTDNSVSPLTHMHDSDRFQAKWVLKGHAETPFWRWVCSWARALRRPSDYGFNDDGFVLPDLHETDHIIDVSRPLDGKLFAMPAVGIREEREERKATITERCDLAAELASKSDMALLWTHFNYEADQLERTLKDSVQVQGSDSVEYKEETLLAFADGQIKYLVTKPKIGAFGMNFQRCAHVIFFASHSYEQYYQGIRRCWRFGQKRPVHVDTIYTEGERLIMKNIKRKSIAATRMFDNLIGHMNNALKMERKVYQQTEIEVPSWIQ